MSNLLVCSVVNGRYLNYIDMWQLAMSKAYPEYDTCIRTTADTHSEIPYYAACLRYLHDFGGKQKYCYITDIDMMIVREPVALLDFHLNEMKESGLCYSNSPRGQEFSGPKRLTGLHFVNDDWWDVTAETRDKYTALLMQGKIGMVDIDDELMLMNIVVESGLAVARPVVNLMERHHGLHLGTVRANKKNSIQTLRRAVSIRVDKDKAIKWQEVVSCPEYVKILDTIKRKDRIAYQEFMEMDKFTKQLSK